MKVAFKIVSAILSMIALAFFANQVAINPTEFHIACLVIMAFVTIFYILIVFQEFTD